MRPLLALFLVSLVLTGASAVQAARTDTATLDRLAHADDDGYVIGYVERRVERTFDGSLDAGGTRSHPIDVRYDNLTRVDVILSWSETGDTLGATGADTFRVEVARPDGQPMDGSPSEGAGGVLVLRSDLLNPVPERTTVHSDEVGDVMSRKATEGRGTWRAAVTLTDTGGTGDEENAYVLTVVIRHYEASPLKVVTLAPPSAQASAAAAGVWTWTTAGLAAVSLGLGGMLVVDHLRRRTA